MIACKMEKLFMFILGSSQRGRTIAHLHKEGHQYQSLNSYRSAIASMHAPIDRILTLHTVMLLALTRPSRSADLAKLNLVGYRNTPEGAVFLPTVLAKQSRPGKKIKEFFFSNLWRTGNSVLYTP